LAIAGYVFHVGPLAPTVGKISLLTVFESSNKFTKTAPSPIVDSSTFPTSTGALVDTDVMSDKPNKNDLISFLQATVNAQYKDVVNEITATDIGNANGQGYYHMEVTALTTSRTYEDSAWVYFNWNPSGTASLANDFKTTAISDATNRNVSSEQLFGDLRNANDNSNLNTNAIILQYKDSNNTWED
jgi:hypothetical protein